MTLPLFIIRFAGLSFLSLLFSFPFLCLWQFNLIYLCSSSKATNELLFALCRFYAKTFDLSLFVLCLIDFLLLLFRTPHRLLMPQGIKNSLYCEEIWTEAVLKHSFIALKLRKWIVKSYRLRRRSLDFPELFTLLTFSFKSTVTFDEFLCYFLHKTLLGNKAIKKCFDQDHKYLEPVYFCQMSHCASIFYCRPKPMRKTFP